MFESPVRMARIFPLISAALLFCGSAPSSSVEHSLFYTYTALSKPVDLPGIYEFIALGTLDDRELDYYNSRAREKVPMQTWMKKKMPQDYWDKGTQSRKSKEQWFKVNVDILIDRMRHNKTELHVLQWRHGCVIEGENGNSKFVRGIDEYSYDGTEFLSFDEDHSRWIAPVQAAEPTKRKWDDVDILNQYTKSYLQKECVDWLTKFMDYRQEELTQSSQPEVHLFAKKSVKDSKELTLTCLATGFFPRDVKVCIRKGKTSIPEHLLMSSGVRPNGDGTYQLRKSLEILEDEKAMYDCQVSHITLTEPITVSPGKDIPCLDCSALVVWGVTGGLLVGALLTLAGIAVAIICLKKAGRFAWKRNGRSPNASSNDVAPSGADSGAGTAASSLVNVTEGSQLIPESGADSGAGTAASSLVNVTEGSQLIPESDSAAGSSSDRAQQSICENMDQHSPC